jgi:hypothetical protein
MSTVSGDEHQQPTYLVHFMRYISIGGISSWIASGRVTHKLHEIGSTTKDDDRSTPACSRGGAWNRTTYSHPLLFNLDLVLVKIKWQRA